MPITTTSIRTGESLKLVKGEYDARYPKNMNLDPTEGSQNQNLASQIFSRALSSRFKERERHKSWRKIDEMLTAFVRPDEAERLEKKQDVRRPVSIVLPQLYSTLMTELAITMSVLGDRPLFRYESSRKPIAAILLERVIGQQGIRGKHFSSKYIQFRDAWAYGRGMVAPVWEERFGKRTTWETDSISSKLLNPNGNGQIITDRKRVRKNTKLFEGHVLKNIDPYMMLPDQNVSVNNFQNGEFIGWIERTNFISLLSQEQSDTNIFNVKHIAKRARSTRSALFRADDAFRDASGIVRPATVVRHQHHNFTDTSPVDVIWMYLKLIPKDWGFSNSTKMETWLFGLAGDEVVISAHKMDLDHGMFPVSIISPTMDGYSANPVSSMEIDFSLQEVSNWFISSHILNVAKSVHNSFIVDPSIINIHDLQNNAPGRLHRVRRRYFNDPDAINKGIKQLEINDVTKQNLTDVQFFDFWAGKGAGLSPSLQGIQQRSGSRVSASEAQGTRVSGLNRIEVAMTLMAEMDDLPYLLASQTLQFMEESVFAQITGRNEEQLRAEFGSDEKGVEVNAWDLSPDYDIVPRTGDLPNGDFSQGLIQALQIATQDEELRGKIDIFRFFQHVARQLGAKHVHEFTRQGGSIQTQIQPNEQVENQVQQGNLVELIQAQ